MSDREAIFRAMGRSEIPTGRQVNSTPATPSTTAPSWARFSERLAELGGHCVVLDEAPYGASLLRLLDDLGIVSRTAFLDDDAAEILRMKATADVWTADLGITMARTAVEETGGVLIEAGPGRHRLASLSPPVHVALVYDDALVKNLEEALGMGSNRTSVIVTGPSRTADIEGVLVRGVHGPKELVVARLPSANARERN